MAEVKSEHKKLANQIVAYLGKNEVFAGELWDGITEIIAESGQDEPKYRALLQDLAAAVRKFDTLFDLSHTCPPNAVMHAPEEPEAMNYAMKNLYDTLISTEEALKAERSHAGQEEGQLK
jgi:hypothetical protein